ENGDVFLARPDEPFVPLAESEFNVEGTDAPETLGDLTRVSPFVAATNPAIVGGTFGVGTEAVQIPANGGDALALQPLYDYDVERNVVISNQTGEEFSPVDGVYTSQSGDEVRPGYYAVIGLRNFQRLFTSDLFGGEFVIVFVWTFLHAILTVFVTFALGLTLAIILNHELVPAKKIFRSMLLVPYAIPAFISVLVWRGLLDPTSGVVNEVLNLFTFGLAGDLPWRSNPFWARTGIILVQMWLGFPYMLLICTGALQSIPSDMYEAADVDGAGPFRKFWNLTLPLLLVAIGPLLIASFAFNFNNFTVIQLYNDGRPTIDTDTIAGYTDILITYTYEVAFSSGRGADYGFATAITIVIFVLLSIVTIFNFRLTRQLEEISENV
ncbi:MAG: ABC transporter permease subunit, partial [Chloroflexota bacterium]